MMPQTVPNSPTKGAVEPMVARIPVPRRIRLPAWASTRSRIERVRSLTPAGPDRSSAGSDRWYSASAACAMKAAGSRRRASARLACSSEAASRMVRPDDRARARATATSPSLKTSTVQVRAEAAASRTITAFTTQWAARNMPQGDRSRPVPCAAGGVWGSTAGAVVRVSGRRAAGRVWAATAAGAVCGAGASSPGGATCRTGPDRPAGASGRAGLAAWAARPPGSPVASSRRARPAADRRPKGRVSIRDFRHLARPPGCRRGPEPACFGLGDW